MKMVAALFMGGAIRPRPVFVKVKLTIAGTTCSAQDKGEQNREFNRYSASPADRQHLRVNLKNPRFGSSETSFYYALFCLACPFPPSIVSFRFVRQVGVFWRDVRASPAAADRSERISCHAQRRMHPLPLHLGRSELHEYGHRHRQRR